LIRRHGGPEVISYEELPTPVPKEREVLVKAHAIGDGKNFGNTFAMLDTLGLVVSYNRL